MAKLLSKAICDVFSRSVNNCGCYHGYTSRRSRLWGSFCRYEQYQESFCRKFSASLKRERLQQEVLTREVMLVKLESALREHQVDKAWDLYKDFECVYGFPDKFLLSRLIMELSYTSNKKWLRRAYDLFIPVSKERPHMLQPELLTKLTLALARAQMPVAASTVLRVMLEKRCLPPVDVLRLFFMHMVKTDIGTHLASNILVQISSCFQKFGANNSITLTKPDTLIFNLVLDACSRYQLSLKGQEIIEVMSQVGVVGDAQTIVLIAQIHDMNGLRDELKKFKYYVDQAPTNLVAHYCLFYDCLLRLHFKFNDIDSATTLIKEMCQSLESDCSRTCRMEPQKPCSVSIGSENIRMGLRLQILPEQLQESVCTVDRSKEFVLYGNGKLLLSNKSLAKLLIGYKRCGRLNELSKLLVVIQGMLTESEKNNVFSDVIHACINLSWLETAHDILDDLESEGNQLTADLYASLLAAYNCKKMFREAEALLKQMRRAGIVFKKSDVMVSPCTSKSNNKLTSSGNSDLAMFVIKIITEEEKSVSYVVNEYNSSIYFFTRAKMIEDALSTYKKMQSMKIQPTVSTFFHLISGLSYQGMYRQVTTLWGDIKRTIENGNSLYNRDLFELLLINFLRGGYFERVMEVIGLMMKNGMYLDKWMYKTEFLKFHKDLYRSLNASNARNEAQKKRLGHVQEFKIWAGIS